MKLSNFLKYDPSYHGKGLQAGSKLEKEIWDTFASDLKRLSDVASAIKSGVPVLASSNDSVTGIVDPEEEADEGKLLIALHKRRERDASFARKKKELVLSSSGALACEICSFDFYRAFGPHGYGFAECHHDRPLSKMNPGEKTKLSDLRIVCANCHRMLHRGKSWPTITELQSMIASQKA